ncbi:hypothetical protein SYYSPA8_13150 [Streptomyces yaizuensis]|uniref:Tn3 transposase DDE domain-containing protein n=1 Tax=Streptomyces yaizuensis TaxID=2989713 RepID=A0ABQ5NXZ3_9ACTN|nr:hypothetical protein SYYSPA8_13150 [Streptomyces sp. YSPA8]
MRTINAAPNPKYFGFKRGITWQNAVNDQVAGIGQMVVPGTPRDSLHILDALLNLDGGVKPEMVATDNASYSDMVFGLFKILGYNFSPRFRDLDDQRFWRAEMDGVETGPYGALEDLAKNKVNLNKVIQHWEDMLRVAGSLVTNQVRAYDLLRMFGSASKPAPLGQAFAEYGRIAKTLHLLQVVDPVDDTYRRQMGKQLSVQESRHTLARDICHGKKGHINQAYRDGMEDQLGALGLVLNAVVLWTTKYIDAAVAQLRAEGHEIADEDIARLSPLKPQEPERPGALQLHLLHPGRRRPAPAARSERPDPRGRGGRRGVDGSRPRCRPTGADRHGNPTHRVLLFLASCIIVSSSAQYGRCHPGGPVEPRLHPSLTGGCPERAVSWVVCATTLDGHPAGRAGGGTVPSQVQALALCLPNR